MEMDKHIGKNFTTRGDNFNIDKQYKIDYDFADQLISVIDKINKDYPYIKLTTDSITNYDGKHFTIKGEEAVFTEKELFEYAKNKNEILRKDFVNTIVHKEDEEGYKYSWQDIHNR